MCNKDLLCAMKLNLQFKGSMNISQFALSYAIRPTSGGSRGGHGGQKTPFQSHIGEAKGMV